jgi:hypothetical protein
MKLWDSGEPLSRWNYLLESRELEYSRFPQINFQHLVHQVDTSPAVDIVVDRNLALVCKWEAGRQSYLHQAIALLIREGDNILNEELMGLMSVLRMLNYRKELNADKYEKNLGHMTQKLNKCLFEHRNLKLNWQFSDEQKQLLNNYYAANKLLVDCLQESKASPEVQKEILDTLLLPIVEIKKRKSGITKKLLLDCPQQSNATPELQDTQ